MDSSIPFQLRLLRREPHQGFCKTWCMGFDAIIMALCMKKTNRSACVDTLLDLLYTVEKITVFR